MIEDYVRTDEYGRIVQVLCKGCGAVLQAMTAFGQERRRKMPDGSFVVERNVALRPTEAYADAKIEMQDGRVTHYHTTPLCAKCVTGMKTQDLQAVYRIDLQQFRREGVSQKLLQAWMRRRAVKVCAVGDARNPVI